MFTIKILDAEFDVERMDVFSIERKGKETVIGFIWDGQIEEWSFECHEKKHAELHERLRNKLALNSKNEPHK